MSSTKRTASDLTPSGTPPLAKRQDTGSAKQEDVRITPAPKPGSYRLVKGLRSSVTGDANDLWPGLWLDTKLKDLLLEGKKIPKSVKDALEYPGVFRDVKVSDKSKIVPIWLIGNNNMGALWVPSSLLMVMEKRGIECVLEDLTTPKALRSAYRTVLKGHDLGYWVQHLYRESEEVQNSDAEQVSDGSDNDSSYANSPTVKTAASRMLANARQYGPASAPVKPGNAAFDDNVLQGDAAVDLPMTDADMPATMNSRHGCSKPQAHQSTTDRIASSETEMSGSDPKASASASLSFETNSLSASKPEDIETSDTPNTKAFVEVEGEGAEPSSAIMAKESVVTGVEDAAAAGIQERRRARRTNADRKAAKDEIRLSIGRCGDEFIVKRSGVDRSDYLKERVEYDPDDDEFHISSHKFLRFNADDFDAVAEFLNTDDFEPVIIKDETSTQVLKNFNRTDTVLTKKLITRSVKICGIAGQLQLPELSQLAIQKFKLLAPYNANDFVDFLCIMEKQDYCNDTELQGWLMQYSADHLYELLEGEPRFRTFLEKSQETEKKILRIKVGLPAEDPTLASKKKVSRRKAPKKEGREDNSGSSPLQAKKSGNAAARKTAAVTVETEPVESISSPTKPLKTKKSSGAGIAKQSAAAKITPAKVQATKRSSTKKLNPKQTDDSDGEDAVEDQAGNKVEIKPPNRTRAHAAKAALSKVQETAARRPGNSEDEVASTKAKPPTAMGTVAKKPGPRAAPTKDKNFKATSDLATKPAEASKHNEDNDLSSEGEKDEVSGRAKQPSTSAADSKTKAVAVKPAQPRGKKTASAQLPHQDSSSNSHASKVLAVEPPPNMTQKIFLRKAEESLAAKTVAKKANKAQTSKQSLNNSIDELAGTAEKALAGLEAVEAAPKSKAKDSAQASPMANSEDKSPRSDETNQDELSGDDEANGK